MAFPTYSTGTVAVANGATAITGTGTNWTGANAKPGDDIVVDGHTVVVLDVTDATHLAIDAWPYTSVVAGASYKIIKRSPLRFVGGDAMADVSTLVAALNTDGFYVFVGPTETVPDPSFGEEDQFALQPSTGKLWLKTGGVWVFQGVYKGFNITGAWSGATAYAVGDVVSLSGSSYLCLLAHTNHTPPNATYWQVLAAKGDQGIQGNTGAGYGGTSTTSLAIGTGSKAFTTQAGLAYQVGSYVRASSVANGANYMEGLVTAYASTTLTVNVTKVGGSGTIASWSFAIAGAPGSGDLLSTNNLSDVASAPTSRTNLGATSVGNALFTAADAAAARTASGAAASATTISGGGLVTGGGDLSANRTVTVTAAVQSDMETATSTTTAVTPGRMKYHPGVLKAACLIDPAGGLGFSYGVTSASDAGVGFGDLAFNFTLASSVVNSSVVGIYAASTSQACNMALNTTTSVRYTCVTANTAALSDPAYYCVHVAGDLP